MAGSHSEDGGSAGSFDFQALLGKKTEANEYVMKLYAAALCAILGFVMIFHLGRVIGNKTSLGQTKLAKPLVAITR